MDAGDHGDCQHLESTQYTEEDLRFHVWSTMMMRLQNLKKNEFFVKTNKS